MSLLEIDKLSIAIDAKPILREVSMTVKPGEVHAILGPNGAGKSSLAQVLAGLDRYQVSGGGAKFDNEDLFSLSATERSLKGLFLAMQSPTEIPGLTTIGFLRHICNAHNKANGLEEWDSLQAAKHIRQQAAKLGITADMLKRPLHVGYSGGEKKRLETLQLMLLAPKLAVLDETDSGLDVDALKILCEVVDSMLDGKRSFLFITHYERLLNYLKPDKVHILAAGKIVASGDMKLAKEVQEHGFQAYA